MVIGMTGELIEIGPPGEALRGILIMFGGLRIRAVTAEAFFQFGIAGENEGHEDGKKKQYQNRVEIRRHVCGAQTYYKGA